MSRGDARVRLRNPGESRSRLPRSLVSVRIEGPGDDPDGQDLGHEDDPGDQSQLRHSGLSHQLAGADPHA
jgi:hypothetical protein